MYRRLGGVKGHSLSHTHSTRSSRLSSQANVHMLECSEELAMGLTAEVFPGSCADQCGGVSE